MESGKRKHYELGAREKERGDLGAPQVTQARVSSRPRRAVVPRPSSLWASAST